MKNKRFYKAEDFINGAEAAKMLGYAHNNSLTQYVSSGHLQAFGEKKARRYLKSEVEALFQLKVAGQLSKKAA